MNETMLLELPELRPVLYTDTVKGEQVCRDDLWAVSTDELNAIRAELTRLRAIAARVEDVGTMAKIMQQYTNLLDAARAVSAWLKEG